MDVKLNGTITKQVSQEIKLLSEKNEERIYEISLRNMLNDGSLQVFFPEGVVQNISGLKNEAKEFDLGIKMDNTPPTGTFIEKDSTNGQSYVIVTASESVQNVSGWESTYANMKLARSFQNPIQYPIPLIDYAGNVGEVLIKVRNATNKMLHYCTLDKYVNKTIDKTCGQIAGDSTVLAYSICKAEGMIIRTEGVADDELLSRVYVYSYWGEGSKAMCLYSETLYQYGYNPSTTGWSVLQDRKIVYANGYGLLLGGSCMNMANHMDRTYKKTIPAQIAQKYLYGISGVAFKLKQVKDLSIVYQILVKDIGWLPAVSDGAEAMYRYDKPMTAIRINFVPNTEKQRLVDYWNRDVGTHQV